MTDARGNTTDFTYDATHGGVLTATAPAPTTNATRPQTRFTFAQLSGGFGTTVYAPGQVSACQTLAGGSPAACATYDAAGQVTLVQTRYGVTGVQADEVATTYTANGQAETLTDGEGNRSTFAYDGHGRLSRTRFPSPTQGAGTR